MKVLFATKNPAKIEYYVKALKDKGIDVITLNDIDKTIDIDESGENAVENAYIKAKSYYDLTGIVTVGVDDNLFIKELPKDMQPGTHVRRVNGKELSDDEMIEYYTNLVKQYGDKLTAKWIYGLVIYDGKETKKYACANKEFYFVDTPTKTRNKGYPLDSISIVPEYNKYLADLTDEEKKERNKSNPKSRAIDFIVNSFI